MNTDFNANNDSHLLEMRKDMESLKSLLKEQKIINETLIRKSMKTDHDKVKSETKRFVYIPIVTIPAYVMLFHYMHMPVWFTAITCAFLLTASCMSGITLHRLSKTDLLTGSLIDVASAIAVYKKTCNRWLCFSLPFLLAWVTALAILCRDLLDPELHKSFVAGGICGLAIGGIAGVMHLLQTRRRLDNILRQIDEINAN